MYSIVLMAALSTGAAEPGFGWRHGCHGCSGGYNGCSGAYNGCGGGYGYGGGYNACCGCYGASAYSGYGYCSGVCMGGYCMGGFTNYAPAFSVPAPEKKPEVVPNPKPKPKPDETSLNDQARLILDVPTDAKIFIDGKPMQNVSAKRVFRTPKLDPKVTYYYDVTVEVVRDGKTVSSTKRVIVRANEEVHTAFADLPAARTEATASAGK